MAIMHLQLSVHNYCALSTLTPTHLLAFAYTHTSLCPLGLNGMSVQVGWIGLGAMGSGMASVSPARHPSC